MINSENSEGNADMVIDILNIGSELKIWVFGLGGDASKARSNIIENDVDVNVKSLNIKQPFEVKLTPSTSAPTKDQAKPAPYD